MQSLKRIIVWQLVCRRRGHDWGDWRPAAEVMGPGHEVPSGWLARECERGCGHVEMPQPGA